MQLLNYIMIFSGSALMVYNIVRYGMFVKSSAGLEKNRKNTGLLIVPLLLLVFFLIGYVVIGITLEPNLLVASILLGGSIFVFLLLTVMFIIIRHLRETDRLLAVRYEEMKEQLRMQADEYLSIFLINLTKDEVEERAGTELLENDRAAVSYTELLEGRTKRVIYGETVKGPDEGAGRMARESLMRSYNDGQTSVSAVALMRSGEGLPQYVRFRATLTKMPVSGDIVAMITEKPFNRQIVRDRLLDTVLMEEYDRISYLVEGTYHELISNDVHRDRMLLPSTGGEPTEYETLYYNYILPAMPKDRKKEGGPNPLRLSVIDGALAERDFYDVDAPFLLNGETRFKHIRFYCVNRQTRFYLMLLSDSTLVTEEQMEQNRKLKEALDDALNAHQEALRSHQEEALYFEALSGDLAKPVEKTVSLTASGQKDGRNGSPEQRLADTHKEALTLRTLVEDLMTMSRIQRGTLEMRKEHANLHRCAQGLVSEFASGAAEKNIRLTADTSGVKNADVCCDRDHMRRVLARLLKNSIAFAPEGAEVRLSIDEEDGPEQTYVFAVRNPGLPMPDEVRAHIFEPAAWNGGTEETRKALPGSAIGMAVVKAFVDAMDGEISVTSGENGDTAFVIRMRLDASEETGACGCPSPTEKKEVFRILLADDNEINREVGQLLLTGEGWEVDTAENGKQALDRVAGAEPGYYGLVLMDIRMPVLDGYGAVRAIRALPGGQGKVPVLAMTADTDPEDVKAAIEAGMDGHLSKPVDPAAVRAEIEKLRAEP